MSHSPTFLCLVWLLYILVKVSYLSIVFITRGCFGFCEIRGKFGQAEKWLYRKTNVGRNLGIQAGSDWLFVYTVEVLGCYHLWSFKLGCATFISTINSGIIVEHRKNVAPGTFGKKNNIIPLIMRQSKNKIPKISNLKKRATFISECRVKLVMFQKWFQLPRHCSSAVSYFEIIAVNICLC